jgi:predicted transposase YbfD/YdcC
LYISNLSPNAQRIGATSRAHRPLENRLHSYMNIAFNDNQMHAHSSHPPQNLATLEHVTLNLIRMVPVKRKDGIKTRRMIVATGNNYCAELFGLA